MKSLIPLVLVVLVGGAVLLAVREPVDTGSDDSGAAVIEAAEVKMADAGAVDAVEAAETQTIQEEEDQMTDASSSTELTATMKTNKGDIHLTLYPDKAPITVASFVNLAQRGYYDGLTFHRVIPNFMVQGGCPLGTGTGSPGYSFQDEFDGSLKHDSPGKLSMANSGPGTNGSQFFITHIPTPWLDGKHTIFGSVVGPEDQAVVDAIAGGDKIVSLTIEGDTSGLLASQKELVDSWNAILDK